MTEEENVRGDALGFVAAVHDAFADIAKDLALKEVTSDRRAVHYEGPPGSLDVLHDPLSYELDLAFTPVGRERERPFGLVDFMRVHDRELANEHRAFAATTPGGVRRGLLQPSSLKGFEHMRSPY